MINDTKKTKTVRIINYLLTWFRPQNPEAQKEYAILREEQETHQEPEGSWTRYAVNTGGLISFGLKTKRVEDPAESLIMENLPVIAPFNEGNLKKCLSYFSNPIFLFKEERFGTTAEYPNHNRFFSNGDKPYVALINRRGIVTLTYENQVYSIKEGEFVFFDDNVHHSWIMKDCDVEIFYYKQCAPSVLPVKNGDCCLDNFFCAS